jgi:glucokinase
MELVAVDVGGTHARFAQAKVDPGGAVTLDAEWKTKVADHADFVSAWREFAGRRAGNALDSVAIGIAGSVNWPESLDPIQCTNNHWIFDPVTLADGLGVTRFCLVNDFVAIGHAVASGPSSVFSPVCGPPGDLPDGKLITVIGPGTGCGIAHVVRGEHLAIHGTEGAHFDFAPVDTLDDALLTRLRSKHGRVSAERVVSGPGLPDIAAVIGCTERHLDGTEPALNEVELWTAGLEGSDPLARAAIEHFCKALGSVAGDVALAQGAKAVVLAGGLGQKLASILPQSGFAERFCSKGRYRPVMEQMKVRLITMPEPGLSGAALAFAHRYEEGTQ